MIFMMSSPTSPSEELEIKDKFLKKIELLFENCYFFTHFEKMFPKF
jgi:hypothetical protein